MRFDPDYTVLGVVTFDKAEALLEADLQNSADAMGRVLACEGLAKQPTDRSVKALKAALQSDPFFGVRQAAARALREMRTEAATLALVDSGDQPEIRVRQAVVEELAQCYHDVAKAKLLEIAASAEELPIVAAAAIDGLGRWSDDAARDAIRTALASRSFNNERAAAALDAIHESADPTWAQPLRAALTHLKSEIDARDLTDGFKALAEISQRGRRRNAAFEFLADFLDDPREPLRLAAIEALGVLRDPRAERCSNRSRPRDRSIDSPPRAQGAAKLDDQAEFAPAEVRDLRRELRELRESQEKLKKSVDELKGKTGAGDGKSSDDDGQD